MIKPSSATVIRFVALYGNGLSAPITEIILGHGHGREGKSHAVLQINCRIDYEGPMYAGYIGIENGEIKVVDGGSRTLRIPPSSKQDRKLEDELNTVTEMKNAVLTFFPQILSGDVEHFIIPRQ